MINWKQKLSSRKFWTAIIGFITTVLIIFGINELIIEQVIAIISAVALLITYILTEGWIDATREGKQK